MGRLYVQACDTEAPSWGRATIVRRVLVTLTPCASRRLADLGGATIRRESWSVTASCSLRAGHYAGATLKRVLR